MSSELALIPTVLPAFTREQAEEYRSLRSSIHASENALLVQGLERAFLERLVERKDEIVSTMIQRREEEQELRHARLVAELRAEIAEQDARAARARAEERSSELRFVAPTSGASQAAPAIPEHRETRLREAVTVQSDALDELRRMRKFRT